MAQIIEYFKKKIGINKKSNPDELKQLAFETFKLVQEKYTSKELEAQKIRIKELTSERDSLRKDNKRLLDLLHNSQSKINDIVETSLSNQQEKLSPRESELWDLIQDNNISSRDELYSFLSDPDKIKKSRPLISKIKKKGYNIF